MLTQTLADWHQRRKTRSCSGILRNVSRASFKDRPTMLLPFISTQFILCIFSHLSIQFQFNFEKTTAFASSLLHTTNDISLCRFQFTVLCRLSLRLIRPCVCVSVFSVLLSLSLCVHSPHGCVCAHMRPHCARHARVCVCHSRFGSNKPRLTRTEKRI